MPNLINVYSSEQIIAFDPIGSLSGKDISLPERKKYIEFPFIWFHFKGLHFKCFKICFENKTDVKFPK